MKKHTIISLFLVLILLLSATSVSAADIASKMLGDVDADGEIGTYNYLLVKRHYFNTIILNGDEVLRADVDSSGEIDSYLSSVTTLRPYII